MSRESLLILIGILTALYPFSGLPLTWSIVLLPLSGALTALIGFTLRQKRLAAAYQEAHEAPIA